MGNSDSARRVSLDFFARDDLDDNRYWGQIAAQDGSSQSEMFFASILQQYPDRPYRLRALFWAERALDTAQSDNEKSIIEDFIKNQKGYLFAKDEKFGVDNRNVLMLLSCRELTARGAEISVKDIPKLEDCASLGDTKSASTLVGFYEKTMQYYKQFYWLNIAAENGDLGSCIYLGQMFNFGSSSNDRLRAAFWAERVLQTSHNSDFGGEAKELANETWPQAK
jgi:hypothetical protein